jgi:hypothetical protein
MHFKVYVYIAKVEMLEPTNCVVAMQHPRWYVVMKHEYDSIIQNGTWELVELPKRVQPITCRWVFKVMKFANGEIEKLKAWFFVRGFEQQKGIYLEKKFALIMKWAIIRMVISLVVQHGWKIKHLDIKITFLNGDLKEDMFMLQFHGFVKEGSEHLVYKLNCVLYGLK